VLLIDLPVRHVTIHGNENHKNKIKASVRAGLSRN